MGRRTAHGLCGRARWHANALGAWPDAVCPPSHGLALGAAERVPSRKPSPAATGTALHRLPGHRGWAEHNPMKVGLKAGTSALQRYLRSEVLDPHPSSGLDPPSTGSGLPRRCPAPSLRLRLLWFRILQKGGGGGPRPDSSIAYCRAGNGVEPTPVLLGQVL